MKSGPSDQGECRIIMDYNNNSQTWALFVLGSQLSEVLSSTATDQGFWELSFKNTWSRKFENPWTIKTRLNTL